MKIIKKIIINQNFIFLSLNFKILKKLNNYINKENNFGKNRSKFKIKKFKEKMINIIYKKIIKNQVRSLKKETFYP